MGVERKSLSKASLKSMESYTWPGNVRELEKIFFGAPYC